MKAKFFIQKSLEGAEALKTLEILQGYGKVMKVRNADKLTQVCTFLLIRDPKERKKEVNRVAVVYSTDIRGRPTLMSI